MFPLTTVTIYLNCGPILTVLMGGIFNASEKLTLGNLAKAIFTFIGVLLISIGTPKVTQTKNFTDDKPKVIQEINWFNYVLMALMPVLIAFGNHAMG